MVLMAMRVLPSSPGIDDLLKLMASWFGQYCRRLILFPFGQFEAAVVRDCLLGLWFSSFAYGLNWRCSQGECCRAVAASLLGVFILPAVLLCTTLFLFGLLFPLIDLGFRSHSRNLRQYAFQKWCGTCSAGSTVLSCAL